ncbi:MAG: hypothetical protein LBP19_02895 [Treponema sp.]|nr:hypothetical protein [Treponema sp.]
MSYRSTIGVKGADETVEALRQFLDHAVQGEGSGNNAADFFGEIGISINPLKKGEREFSLFEDDYGRPLEIDDPYPFFTALSESFPQLCFFCFSAVNTDNGNGVEYRIYKDGALIEENNEFYDGSECGGYACTRVPAEACYEWVKAKYDHWQLEDTGGETSIAEAQQAERTARGKWAAIHDFLLDGGVDCLDTDRRILRMPCDLDMLRLLEEHGGYNGLSITEIETIDFSDRDYREEWDELPDLSDFTGLKRLNLTGTPLKELPQELAEKAKAGTLEIIGFRGE